MIQEVKFKILGGPMDGYKLSIAERVSCIVGRAEDSNVIIPPEVDMTVSRHHCLLDINPPAVVVRDLGSSNGTFINGKRLNSASNEATAEAEKTIEMPHEYVLNHGDELVVGETVFLVEISGVACCMNCGIGIPVTELSVNRRNTNSFQCESCYLDGQKKDLQHVVKLFDPSVAITQLPGNERTGTKSSPPPTHSTVEIAGYQLTRKLGEGGSAVVYLATNEISHKTMAVKVLHPKASINKHSRQCFLREMHNTCYLHHCNIVEIMESGYSNGLFYFCMKYCPGGDLGQLVKKRGGRLELHESCNLMIQILDGLEYAHNVYIPGIKLDNGQIQDAKGLVHRDIKPGNIFVNHENGNINVKIADFGLSKAFDLAGLSGCTLTGAAAGTPKYMPRSLLVDFKYSKPDIDVWSAAATFYYMLTGECPREFPPGVDLLRQVLETDAVPIRKRNRDIPKKLAKVIDYALNENKGLRFKSAMELKEAIYAAIKQIKPESHFMTAQDNQEKKYTQDDAKRLWEGTIDESFQPELSIKPVSRTAQAEAYSSLIIRDRILVSKQDHPDFVGSDFEMISLIGQGGMGVVFGSLQTSLDREVAVKMIKADSAQDTDSRNKFLGEAMVTANLDHPNIVPVHDLGTTAEGYLFYSMKNIKGVSWDAVMDEKSLSDNLEVLLKVCDAIAFAHDKGVIHRDLKPDNIMLGDYGEVLVLDWGLAARGGMGPLGAKTEQLNVDSSRAGTPKYMSPEMSKCDFDKVGVASDIYLLGGILYEIVTGLTPHAGGNVYACLYHAMINTIQPTDKQGELVDIALKALASEPEDRFASVIDFQMAIRLYRNHEESLALESSAQKDMASALETGDYELFARSMFGFHEALEQWEGNMSAYSGLYKVRFAYASYAFKNGDLDLADSLIDETEHSQKLKTEIEKSRKLRATRQRHAKNMKIVLAAGTLIIVLGSSVFSIWIGILRAKSEKEQKLTKEALVLVSNEKDRAEKALDQVKLEQVRTQKALELVSKEKDRTVKALVQVKEEQKRTKSALTRVIEEKQKADAERNKAVISERKAVSAKKQTEVAQEKRDFALYSHELKAAQGLILNGSKEMAKKRLLALNKDFRDWEWDRLYRMAGSTKKLEVKGRFVGNIFFSPDSSRFAIMDSTKGYGVCIYSTDSLKLIKRFSLKKPTGWWNMAFTHDNSYLVVAVLRQRKALSNVHERELTVSVYDMHNDRLRNYTVYDWNSTKGLRQPVVRVFSIPGSIAIKTKKDQIILLDLKTGTKTVRNADEGTFFKSLNSTGKVVQQEERNGRIKLVLYDILNNRKKHLYSLKSPGVVKINSSGSYLIFLNERDKKLRLIDINRNKIVREIKGVNQVKIDYSSSGKYFALRYINPRKGPCIGVFGLDGKMISAVTGKPLSKNSLFKYSVIFSSRDNFFGIGAEVRHHAYQRRQASAGIWRVVDGRIIWPGAWTALTPDEQRVVNVELPRKIIFQPANISYGKESKSISISPNRQYSVNGADKFNYIPVKRRITGRKSSVTLNDRKTGKVICTLASAYDRVVYGVARIHFSQDSRKVIVTRSKLDETYYINNQKFSQKSGVDVYDTNTGKMLESYNMTEQDIFSKTDPRIKYGVFQFEIAPGSGRVCYLGKDSVKLVEDRKTLFRFDRHISSFCFSPDGSLIVSYYFGVVKAWRLKDKKVVCSYRSPLNHRAAMAVSPDNRRLLMIDAPRSVNYTQNDSALLKVVDLRDGTEVIDFPVTSSRAQPRMGISFTEDGKNVIISGMTKAGETIIW